MNLDKVEIDDAEGEEAFLNRLEGEQITYASPSHYHI